MLSSFIKNLSILKKFLFINLLVFVIFGSLTIVYLIGIQPNLIHNKKTNHIQIIDNTIEHIRRLHIQFNEDDIKKFLFSTRFLFQNLDRVLIFDSDFNLIGDTDTLDLDPRSFSQRLEIVEMDILSDDIKFEEKEIGKSKKEDSVSLSNILMNYSKSTDFGKPFTFTQESYEQFLLITIKNVNDGEKNIGLLAITEKANDIKEAINESKILSTALNHGSRSLRLYMKIKGIRYGILLKTFFSIRISSTYVDVFLKKWEIDFKMIRLVTRYMR